MSAIPQFDFSYYLSEMFWVAFSVLCITVFLGYVVFPKFNQLIQKRQDESKTIQDNISILQGKISNIKDEIKNAMLEYQEFKTKHNVELDQKLSTLHAKYDLDVKKEFNKKYDAMQKKIDDESLSFQKDAQEHFDIQMKDLRKSLNIQEVKK